MKGSLLPCEQVPHCPGHHVDHHWGLVPPYWGTRGGPQGTRGSPQATRGSPQGTRGGPVRVYSNDLVPLRACAFDVVVQRMEIANLMYGV